MRTILFLGFIFMFVAFVSCNKTVERRLYHFPTIELNRCDDTIINEHIVQFCFDSVYDSRCPLNLECFWQGEATVKLSLHTDVGQKSFKLSTINYPPTFRNDTTVFGYRIKLLSLLPYPGDNSNTPYRVELSVAR